MERKIGEIFEYQGEWYQCVKDDYPFNCQECCFYNRGDKKCSEELTGYCSSGYRSDGKEIIFKKLEKVGEPYAEGNSIVSERMFQKYKTYEKNFFLNERDLLFTSYGDIVSIEIKQNKEYMEENKLNLKPFDIQKAREGKPVCTRDGRKARIICFDRDWDMHIVALVTDPLGESVHFYLSNGKVDFDKQNDEDLMMLPEKKEGWVNVYYNRTDGITFSKHPYPSKEEAIKNAGTMSNIIDTVNISWKE